MTDLHLKVGFAVVGGVAILGVVAWFARNWRFFRHGVAVEGVVVAEERTPDGLLRHVVRYEVNGQTFDAPALPKMGVGTKLPVRYLPESPAEALVGHLRVRLFGPLFMLAWGLMVFLAALK